MKSAKPAPSTLKSSPRATVPSKASPKVVPSTKTTPRGITKTPAKAAGAGTTATTSIGATDVPKPRPVSMHEILMYIKSQVFQEEEVGIDKERESIIKTKIVDSLKNTCDLDAEFISMRKNIATINLNKEEAKSQNEDLSLQISLIQRQLMEEEASSANLKARLQGAIDQKQTLEVMLEAERANNALLLQTIERIQANVKICVSNLPATVNAINQLDDLLNSVQLKKSTDVVEDGRTHEGEEVVGDVRADSGELFEENSQEDIVV